MPNHVTNVITLKGDETRVKNLLESIKTEPKTDDDDFLYIDFNKIIPMPDEIRDTESGSITDQAIAVYLARVEKDYSKLDYIMNYPCYKSEFNDREAFIDFLIEQRDATVELGEKYVNNFRKYGAYTWYEWANKYWGTKWNAYDQGYNEENNEIIFNTAWSGVPELICILSEKNPLVNIEYKFADENFGYNVGRISFFAGTVSDEYFPEGGSEQARELAAEIFGYDPYEDEEDEE